MSNIIITISIILGYFVLNTIMIRLFHKKQNTIEEYSVGSRSFGWLLLSFAYIGGWYVGSIYTGWFANSGSLGMFAQYVIVYSIASLFMMFFMARPVWVWGKIYNLETQADLIQLRYRSQKFKVLFSLLTLLFWSPWLILEMKTIGYVVAAATYQSISFNIGLLIVSAFVIIYSFFGGARASAIGGLIQGLTFTVVGVITMYVLILKVYGGLFNIFPLVEATKPELLTLFGPFGGNYWASVLITGTLGGFALPGVFVGLYRAESPRAIKKSVLVAPFAGILIGFSILVLGLGAFTLPGFPKDAQSGLFWIAQQYNGPVMLGLIGIFALAASMSTISAVINAAAVLVAKDYIASISKEISQEKILKYAKGITIAIGVIAMLIATQNIPNLMLVAIIMYDASVQAFIPLFGGLYWKKANLPGAVLGMLAGVTIALVGNFFPATIIWAGGWSAGIIGLVVNLVINVSCGLIFGKHKHVDELFEGLKNYKEAGSGKLI